MTDNNAKPSGTPKSPGYTAYQVKDRDGAKAIWTRIGAAWAHNADGKGFNVQLDSVPLDGRIVLRVASDKKD